MAHLMERIGEQLIAAGLLDAERLDRGLALQRERGGYLIDVLLEAKLIDERGTLRFLAERVGAQYVGTEKLKGATVPPAVLEKLPVRAAEKFLVLPLAFDAGSGTLRVAISEFDDTILSELKLVTGASAVLPILATRAALRAGIRRFYYADTYAFAALQEGGRGLLREEKRETVLVRKRTTGEMAAVTTPAAEQKPAPERREVTRVMFATPPPDAPRPKAGLGDGEAREPTRIMYVPQAPAPAPAEAPKTQTPRVAVMRLDRPGRSTPAPFDAATLPAVAERTDRPESTRIMYVPQAPEPEPAPPAPASSNDVEVLADSSTVQEPAEAPPERTRMMYVPQPPPEEKKPEPVAATPAAPTPEAPKEKPAAPAKPDPALTKELAALRTENRLLKLGRSLHAHLVRERDVKAILQRTLAFCFDEVAADEGLVFLVDPQSGEITQRCVRTRDESQTDVVFSTTLFTEVLETRQAVLTGDAMQDERFGAATSISEGRLRSAMGVPIEVDGKVRGLIFLGTIDRIDVFGQQDLDALLAIAAEAQLAIGHAEDEERASQQRLSRASLSRFLSPALVEQAAQGLVDLTPQGAVHEATVLFAELRGFSEIAASLSAEEVVQTLRGHFDPLVDVVFTSGGMLDKFMGDSLLALYNVPVAKPGAAEKAVRAGLAMLDALERTNAVREAGGLAPLRLSISVHTGPVVFGAIGARRRLDFTAIGDTVDAAKRLCDRVPPGKLAASEATLQRAPGVFVTEKMEGASRTKWPWSSSRSEDEVAAEVVVGVR